MRQSCGRTSCARGASRRSSASSSPRVGSASAPSRRRLGGPIAEPPAPETMRLCDLAAHGDWVLLGEDRPREVAFGAIGRFWGGETVWEQIDAGGFAAFAAPGYAKLACNFSLRPYGAGPHPRQLRVPDAGDRRRGPRRFPALLASAVALHRGGPARPARRRRRRGAALELAVRHDAGADALELRRGERRRSERRDLVVGAEEVGDVVHPLRELRPVLGRRSRRGRRRPARSGRAAPRARRWSACAEPRGTARRGCARARARRPAASAP